MGAGAALKSTTQRIRIGPGLGCGDGEITALIAEKINRGRVIGIDSSSEMIELAKQRFPSTTHPNLSFILKDAKDINFNCEFDLIFQRLSPLGYRSFTSI
jgi:ubiquinone/menaquinone biosynthesis C-methylase UbiE